MNEAVIPELELLLFSVLSGAASFCGYDILLVVRAFLRRHTVLEKLFDLLYWGTASVLVFSMIHKKNSGVIRAYSILGMLAGMIVYRLIMKDRLVEGARKSAERLRKWWFRKWEPIKNKKKELKIKRKQVKIEKQEKKRKKAEEKKASRQKKRKRKGRNKKTKQREQAQEEKTAVSTED